MSVKTDLHALIDRLSDDEVDQALAFIQRLLAEHGPRHSLLDPPLDDEPETDDERALVAEGKNDLTRGDVVPGEQIFRRYGV